MPKKLESDPQSFLPVKPVDYLILRVLLDGEGHGYGLVQQIAERTGGQVKLVPGNFYAILKRLMGHGLLEELEERDVPDLGNQRRRYYAITALGRLVAAAEAMRMRDLVEDAKTHRLIGEAR